MKLSKGLVLGAMALMFSTAVMMPADVNAQGKGEHKGKGPKMSVEERKTKMDERRAKRDEQFEKQLAQRLDQMAKIEQEIAAGTINEQQKAKKLEILNKHLQMAELLITEHKEQIKQMEENLKKGEDAKTKLTELISKLTAYTPAAKTTPAAPATTATPAVPATTTTPAAPAESTK